jgi:hypothetical protein
MKHFLSAAWFGFITTASVNAQDYHAIQGSSYAGGLGVHNNPASIVNTPFSWDVTLAGAQLTTSSNTYSIHNYSYLSSPANSLYHIDNGQYARKANIDFNINLLNARITLNRRSSIAFGANIRSYTNLKTSEYNYSDTSHGAADFLKINQGISSVQGKLLSSSWFEGYISYAHTLFDNEFGRLNAGITVRVSRGLCGVYANIDNANFSLVPQNNTPVNSISSANILYGYSANLDHWQKSNSTSQNINQLFANGKGGASFDVGAEYLIKPQGTTSFNDDDADYYDYDWKIGLSLTDIGANPYKYGTQSRSISSIKTNISGITLDKTFDSTVNSVTKFNDSLATLANTGQVQGIFTILNPVRLIANIDHYLTGNFYINAELSLNIPLTSLKKTYLQVKELTLLTVTPRWETKRYGFYLPVQFNNQNRFWVGGAVKAGPLLLGFHNLINLFGKTSTQNGGGYIALILRAPKGLNGKTDQRLNCPKPIW